MIHAPIKLNSAFLALQMAKNDYSKVSGQLPTPSHTITLNGLHTQNVIIVYLLDKNITTAKQFLWISTIKRTWQRNLIIPLNFIDEVHINRLTQSTGIIYSLYELSQLFKAEFVKYPTIYYPSNKKELYQRLVWYAMRLHSKGLLERDLMNATALRMNDKLKDGYSYRETLKKASIAYYYIKENAKPRLTKDEVVQRLKDGGKIRGKQRKDEHAQNVQRVKEALPLHVKPSGKVNVTSLADALNLNRKTIQRIMKTLLAFCFFGFIHLATLLNAYHNTGSLSPILKEAHKYEVSEGLNKTYFIRSSALYYTHSLSPILS
ncbi:MAG: hypothetical protein PHN18_12600 [Sulfurospirillaceae bacterium]|nr:hypothetical protein [Sulfurospirillaceae bacterium]MDD2827703.1 hypothetical protein [Sulfurospirillaceae bacterium]